MLNFVNSVFLIKVAFKHEFICEPVDAAGIVILLGKEIWQHLRDSLLSLDLKYRYIKCIYLRFHEQHINKSDSLYICLFFDCKESITD